MTFELLRLASPTEGRHRREIRKRGSHVVALARACKGRFVCTVTGVIRTAEGAEPLDLVTGPLRPNPTTAIALALVRALGRYPQGVDLVVWTNDQLVRPCIQARRRPRVRPPEIDNALMRLRRVVEVREGAVQARRARKGAAIEMEIVGIRTRLVDRTPLDEVLRQVRCA